MLDYKTQLTKDDVSFLEGLFPQDVLTSAEEMHVYGTDASMRRGTPLAVVRASRVQQIQELFRWANQERVPIYVRGRGTNLVGDCVPVIPGIVVSTLKMDAILEISNEDFVAVVEPGVNTGVFQAACEAKGLYYPPDPATVHSSTIGGNVITCAGGMRALKYGVTRDFVLGVEVVLPNGELVRFGGRNHKDVVGLDLARLMVGSEGTLGFISKIWLKLLPKPQASASVLVGYEDCEAALGAVGKIFAAGVLPCALEYIGDRIVRLMGEQGNVPWPKDIGALLLLRVDGSEDTLPFEVQSIVDNIPTSIWHVTGMGAEEEALWEIRRRINPTAFLLGPNKLSDDVTVPRGMLTKAIRIIEGIGEKHDVTLIHFGHVGDGNIHVNFLYDATDTVMTERVYAAKYAVNKALLALGGTCSGEHGCGIVKDASIQIPPQALALMRGVKAVFDPRGIMNPGKGY